MIKYPKINTLFKRETNNPCNIIIGDYSEEYFGNIVYWNVEEKIDGTNIRFTFDDKTVEFGGRTDNADIPAKLLNYLKETFTLDVLNSVFPDAHPNSITLFGEGYGPKIQSGGYYDDEQRFVLFDVKIGHLWLAREAIRDIAYKLHIPCAPQMDKPIRVQEIIDYVKSKPNSLFAKDDHVTEGIIARTDLLNRRGERVMFKLKVRDFDFLSET